MAGKENIRTCLFCSGVVVWLEKAGVYVLIFLP